MLGNSNESTGIRIRGCLSGLGSGTYLALADGSPLSADDGDLRLVLPDEEGKLNLRMLAELQVVQ